MPDIRGHKLCVNLSASQVRRRLKGFGHGVRKVQSAGRNQAVIIHTATGQHLQELRALFADTICSDSLPELGIPVENLRNLGPTSAAWLREIGVRTRADLERVGPIVAYKMIRRQQPSCTPNLLWALWGALHDQDSRDLPEQTKQRLRQEAEG